MPAGRTYTPLARTTLTSSAASVTFSSISGSYTDLVLVGAVAGLSTTIDAWIRVGNGSIDTGTNYSYTVIGGNGTTAGSGRGTNVSKVYWNFMNSITNASNSVIINFMNYSNTTTNKSFLTRGAYSTETTALVGLWRNTSAINTIQLGLDSTATFSSGSTFTLYGILAA